MGMDPTMAQIEKELEEHLEAGMGITKKLGK